MCYTFKFVEESNIDRDRLVFNDSDNCEKLLIFGTARWKNETGHEVMAKED